MGIELTIQVLRAERERRQLRLCSQRQERREAYANRARTMTAQQDTDPQGWVDGLLETERILG